MSRSTNLHNIPHSNSCCALSHCHFQSSDCGYRNRFSHPCKHKLSFPSERNSGRNVAYSGARCWILLQKEANKSWKTHFRYLTKTTLWIHKRIRRTMIRWTSRETPREHPIGVPERTIDPTDGKPRPSVPTIRRFSTFWKQPKHWEQLKWATLLLFQCTSVSLQRWSSPWSSRSTQRTYLCTERRSFWSVPSIRRTLCTVNLYLSRKNFPGSPWYVTAKSTYQSFWFFVTLKKWS